VREVIKLRGSNKYKEEGRREGRKKERSRESSSALREKVIRELTPFTPLLA
jgi:hypothetical protein